MYKLKYTSRFFFLLPSLDSAHDQHQFPDASEELGADDDRFVFVVGGEEHDLIADDSQRFTGRDVLVDTEAADVAGFALFPVEHQKVTIMYILPAIFNNKVNC